MPVLLLSKYLLLKTLLNGTFLVKLGGVEKAEIKQIADYLKDLEEGLYET